jgi:5'-nucleotidase
MPKLTVACTARTLFDLDESHQIFVNEGVEAYSKYQLDNEDNILGAGPAYSLIRKLLSLNTNNSKVVEVVLLSRNSPETGLRVFNSLRAHGLDISRAAFTRGQSPSPYIRAFGVDLFLSSEPENVEAVLRDGYAAATVLPSASTSPEECLKIAFDGDAVLFSDESERLYQQHGLEEFTRSESEKARTPLTAGPFKNFLMRLHEIQSTYPADTSPIRTALVTARATPTSERVIRTFQSWKVRVDETFFLGGSDKGEVLNAFGADIFFDDHLKHCESARQHVTTCHVPNVVAHPTAASQPVFIAT